MDWQDVYQVSCTEKVKDFELELQKELNELKNELEENEMVHGIPPRPISSVPLPREVTHFRNERRTILERAMQVSEAQPLVIQADVMQEEMEATEKQEYTHSSLPLLLHQYFLDRIHQLVNCKHMHMLRWKRFSENISSIESLYTLYQTRLQQIMAEYNDCIERAQRLSVVKEAYWSKTDQGLQAVKLEDLIIYLRWLVCHLHSMRTFNQYLRVLQWLPISRKMEFVCDRDSEDVSSSSRMASRYQDDSLNVNRPKSASSRPQSAASSMQSQYLAPPVPPPINSSLLSTTPLSSSSFVYASAAAGGGVAGDEDTLNLPLHMNEFDKLRPLLNFLLNIYGINYDIDQVTTSAEEMEIYAAVCKKFRQIFTRQEHMKTYRTYDRFEPGQENWGADTSIHALCKESNWQQFVSLKPEKDPYQEKRMTQLRQDNKVDELLRVQAHFVQVPDSERVQDALKEHAALVRDPPNVQPASVTANKTPYSTSRIMKKIYTNPDLYLTGEREDDASVQEIDERDVENVNLSTQSRASSASSRKRKDSYDYFNTVQMLGLDEGDQESNDPSTIQGAYMSYLLLRHLRIRDLQRTALGVLNYFRSVERTLTINDGGLSMESDKVTRTSQQNHRRSTEADGTVGGGGGLGSHGYLHNTPLDFKLSETEFMEFSEIENHDDFYIWEEGRVHVQDQRGYYIIYDAATQDFKDLESNMLLLASHYIKKDRDLRTASGIKRSSSIRRRQSVAGDTDLSSYAHQEVDRFAILMDLWTNEAAFLECKKELLDCYLEAYQHVFDRDEKRSLAQIITSIMHKRPRFDFADHYFIKTYRTECVTLRLHSTLLKNILDKQIEEQREYIQRVGREGDGAFGLPHKVIPKQPVSINMSRAALKNVYMLEFHPSLAIAARLPEALRYAYGELVHVHRPETMYEQVVMERRLLEAAVKEWDRLSTAGLSFSPQVQKDLFSGVFVEDPLFICEIAQTQWQQLEQALGRSSQKERQLNMVKTLCRMMETVTTRHRLIDMAWESEILSKLYRRQAVEMGFEDYHLFLRFVQFEFANYKEDAGKAPPIFITAIQEDDINVDRYTPSFLYLAIQELDENHVGRFSFRSRDGLLQVLRPGGLENVQVTLKAQVVHKNALMCSVQQANACQPLKEAVSDKKSGRASPSESKSEKSSLTQMTGMSSGTQATALASKRPMDSRPARTPESFISIQLEKAPSRDLMLNEFVKKKTTMGTVLRNPEEMEKLKRSLVSEFCLQFWTRMSQYSLRSQIIAYYNSILGLLEHFPNIRDTYFLMGDVNEKKTAEDSVDGLVPDPRQMKKRPRRLLSADGQNFLNLWFIPHHTEVLIMFKTLDDVTCVKALTDCVRVVSSLHDILQYLCAHSRLGSSHARLGSQKMEFVSADWGGTEGIGAELREIQKQMNNLPAPTNPETVADFLALRKEVMFLEMDTAVRHSTTDTFLSTGNVQAFKAITNNIYCALPALSNIQRPSLFSTYISLPEPLEARDSKAAQLYPWRSFYGRNGPYPTMFWPFHRIEHNIQLTLAGLKDVDRHVANGELLGVVLLMEDVLLTGFPDKASLRHDGDEEDGNRLSIKPSPAASRPSSRLGKELAPPSSTLSTRPGSARLTQEETKKMGLLKNLDMELKLKDKIESLGGKWSSMKNRWKAYHMFFSLPPPKKGLSRTQEPLDSYKLLKSFLLLWKRLEIVKSDWGRRKLAVERIETPSNYKEFCKQFKMEVLFPVLQSVARRVGQGDMYEGIVSDTEPLVMPKGSSEIEIRSRQLSKLLESLECHMITEVRKKLSREMTLVLAERAREEGALPTDLWKKPVMKESYTITRPHIAENFAQALMADCMETDENITLSKAHLDSCILELAQKVMAREKQNYESYTMYYENLLRVNHTLLYQKEQEVKQLRDQIKSAGFNAAVDVQCQMADQAHDILMEITALRAKIAEMREMSLTQERDVRERVKDEYEDLVQNLFIAVFQLKSKFDEFRSDLHDDAKEKISETRKEAVEAMTKLNQRYGIISVNLRGSTSDNAGLKVTQTRAEQMRELEHENHNLNRLILKMKAMNSWRKNQTTVNHMKTIGDLRKEADHCKKEYVEVKMIAEEEVILLRQQQVAIRKALSNVEKECNEVKKLLDKEVKAKQEKSHVDLQRARSQKQLQSAKSDNMEKLLEELDEKDARLKLMMGDMDKNTKISELNQDKVKKDVNIFKKHLAHERTMKLDAFSRVDELQAQIYDYESMQRSQSAISLFTAPASTKSRSTRTQSAKIRGSQSTRPGTASTTGLWPPPIIWLNNRSVTPELGGHREKEYKKIQRPKTVSGRLRSRIAEQLLYELEPEENLNVQLQQLQLDSIKEKNF